MPGRRERRRRARCDAASARCARSGVAEIRVVVVRRPGQHRGSRRRVRQPRALGHARPLRTEPEPEPAAEAPAAEPAADQQTASDGACAAGEDIGRSASDRSPPRDRSGMTERSGRKERTPTPEPPPAKPPPPPPIPAAAPSRGASGVTVASPGSATGSGGSSDSGSDSRAALSSSGITCRRRGSKTHSATCSRPPDGNVRVTCQLPSPRLRESHCPSSGVRAGRGEALGHDVAEPGTGSAGVAGPAHGGGLGLVGDVGALGQDRPFEPAHALDRDAGGVGDLLRRLAGADSCLDLLGSQRTLHFNLVLGEPGGLALRDGAEPLVDRQDKTPAAPRDGEDSVTTVLADRDEAQLLHRRPFPCPAAAPPYVCLARPRVHT